MVLTPLLCRSLQNIRRNILNICWVESVLIGRHIAFTMGNQLGDRLHRIHVIPLQRLHLQRFTPSNDISPIPMTTSTMDFKNPRTIVQICRYCVRAKPQEQSYSHQAHYEPLRDDHRAKSHASLNKPGLFLTECSSYFITRVGGSSGSQITLSRSIPSGETIQDSAECPTAPASPFIP